MCLAIPAKLVEILSAEQGIVDLGGIRKEVSIELVPGAAVGDYLIVHVGHAIGQVDPVEAERTLALFGELAQTLSAEQAVAEPGTIAHPDEALS